MKQSPKISFLFALAIIFLNLIVFSPGQAFSWTVTADFENGNIGSESIGTDAFSYVKSPGYGIHSDTYVQSGCHNQDFLHN